MINKDIRKFILFQIKLNTTETSALQRVVLHEKIGKSCLKNVALSMKILALSAPKVLIYILSVGLL